MPSLRGPNPRGPDSLVSVTNAAGLANSDAAPTVTAPTQAAFATAAALRDVPMQTLLTLRVIARLLQETLVMNQSGAASVDDLDAMIADEATSMGMDALS